MYKVQSYAQSQSRFRQQIMRCKNCVVLAQRLSHLTVFSNFARVPAIMSVIQAVYQLPRDLAHDKLHGLYGRLGCFGEPPKLDGTDVT